METKEKLFWINNRKFKIQKIKKINITDITDIFKWRKNREKWFTEFLTDVEYINYCKKNNEKPSNKNYEIYNEEYANYHYSIHND